MSDNSSSYKRRRLPPPPGLPRRSAGLVTTKSHNPRLSRFPLLPPGPAGPGGGRGKREVPVARVLVVDPAAPPGQARRGRLYLEVEKEMNAVDELTFVVTGTTCHLCGAAGLLEFVAFRQFRRITSDCRPWPAGGRLCGCPSCGTVQKIVDEEWNREVAELYAGYAIYDQAEGAEQAVFDQATGAAASRSTRLLAAPARGLSRFLCQQKWDCPL